MEPAVVPGPGPRPAVRGAAALLLLLLWLRGCSGSSPHSLQQLYTAVSESSLGLPHFLTVAYVDEQPVWGYDSNTRRAQPKVPWMLKVEKEYAQYLEKETEFMKGWEQFSRADLIRMRTYYNQSAEGFHVIQVRIGCDLNHGGIHQHAYDGRDFLGFDKKRKTLTWTVTDRVAQEAKKKWDVDLAGNHYIDSFLEETCPEQLRKYLGHGKETLLRTELPTVRVARKEGNGSRETLICRIYGFYPKEINATWMKNGEIWEHETFRTKIAPNSDRTYHLWLGVNIDPQQRDLYRCHVRHGGLLKPLEVPWTDPGSNVLLIVGAVMASMAVVVVGLLLIGMILCKKKRGDCYRATPTRPPAGV